MSDKIQCDICGTWLSPAMLPLCCADGQAGQEHRTAPSQEGHAAGPACSAPDEDLIQLIAYEAENLWGSTNLDAENIAGFAIREYIRRSAGKEKL